MKIQQFWNDWGRNWAEIGQKSVKNLVKNRLKFGWNLVKIWSKIGQKLDKNLVKIRSKIGLKMAK